MLSQAHKSLSPASAVGTKVKIDFVVAGFSKCGSTTLCALLDLHPDIYIPPIKEPWYFCHKEFETQHAHYDGHYAAAEEHQKKGDGSIEYSGYLSEDISVERIYQNNPECRFLFIARNPKSRIESSYREMHHSGVQFGIDAPYSLEDCLQMFPQMIQDTRYWERISKFRNKFGDEAISVVFLEELISKQQETLESCFTHLGVDPAKFPGASGVNLNAGESKLYDTRLLRRIRNFQPTGLQLAKIDPFTQDKLLAPLRLRRPFGKKTVYWDADSLAHFQREIAPDSLRFLEFYGRPASLWNLQ
jgi:Sulfotransferase domain